MFQFSLLEGECCSNQFLLSGLIFLAQQGRLAGCLYETTSVVGLYTDFGVRENYYDCRLLWGT